MSQHLPPNHPGHGAGDYPPDESQSQGVNPYLNAQPQVEAAPDLDAGAPQLRTVESQRVDRKALMFIAGIIAVLVLMSFLVFRKSSDDKQADAKKPREEKVVIPEFNQPGPPTPDPYVAQEPQLPPLPAAEPIEVEPTRSSREREDEPIAMPPEPQGPTLVERRMGLEGGRGDMGGAGAGGGGRQDVMQAVVNSLQAQQAAMNGGQAAPTRVSKDSVAKYLNNPDALLVRGTYIRCVLETRIITDVAGYTSCIVTEPVYSINGRRLLLPKGSKVLGQYEGEPNGPRVGVVWDRITTPNGLDVTLEGPGVDNLGGAGHPGDYNGHWVSKMTSALMISLISDAFKYAAEKNGPKTSTVTPSGLVIDQPFESNTAKTMERLANQALSKASSRPATVTINQGTVLNVYVAKDVDFSGVVSRR